MSNFGLRQCMKAANMNYHEAAVGDRHVVQMMRDKKFCLGGEQSGHVVLLDYTTTGDGIMTTLKVLEAMVMEKQPLSELAKVMESYPQTMINVSVRERKPFETMPEVQNAIDKVSSALKDRGRILVRYSGTEKLARVMVEGEDPNTIKQYANDVGELIQKEIGTHG